MSSRLSIIALLMLVQLGLVAQAWNNVYGEINYLNESNWSPQTGRYVTFINSELVLIYSHQDSLFAPGQYGFMRVDLDGSEISRSTYGDGSVETYAIGLGEHTAITTEGTMIHCRARSNFGEYWSSYIVEFDNQGDTIWSKALDLGKFYGPHCTIQDSYGDILISGETAWSESDNTSQAFVMKTDTNGDTLWLMDYGDEGVFEFGMSIIENEEGGYFVSGSRVDTIGNFNGDAYLMKIDQDGELLWEEHFGHPTLDETIHFLGNTSDGNYLLAGSEVLGGAEDQEERTHRLRKFDIEGNVIWEKLGGTESSRLNAFTRVNEDSNGDYVCVGMTYDDPFPSQRRGCLSKYEPINGEQQWFHKYSYAEGWDPASYHEMWDFTILPDGGYALVGWVFQSQFQDFRSQDIWLMRVDSDGCLEPGCLTVGINEQVAGLQEVMSVYPNPLQAGTAVTIRFEEVIGAQMPYAEQDTELVLIDALGREVFREALPQQGSNASFSHALTPPALPSGLYTVHWKKESRWFDSIQLVID
jgi:hypothetical protein